VQNKEKIQDSNTTAYQNTLFMQTAILCASVGPHENDEDDDSDDDESDSDDERQADELYNEQPSSTLNYNNNGADLSFISLTELQFEEVRQIKC